MRVLDYQLLSAPLTRGELEIGHRGSEIYKHCKSGLLLFAEPVSQHITLEGTLKLGKPSRL